MIIHKDSHVDHGLSQMLLGYILERFADRTAFFIETIPLPPELGTVACDLHGPVMGDAPVSGADVRWDRRGDRPYNSRLVDRAPRQVRTLTVIAGPHEEPCARCNGTGVGQYSDMLQGGWPMPGGMSCAQCVGGVVKHACVLFTAFGGPPAEKEVGELVLRIGERRLAIDAIISQLAADPSAERTCGEELIAAESEDFATLAKAQLFWSEHALSSPARVVPIKGAGRG